LRRTVVTILAGLAVICAVAVVDVMVLSDGWSRARRRSEDGDRCLEPLDPVKVDVDIDP